MYIYIYVNLVLYIMASASQLRSLKVYFVDTFTLEPFTGNPAAVCLLEEEVSSNLILVIVSFLESNDQCVSLCSVLQYVSACVV